MSFDPIADITPDEQRACLAMLEDPEWQALEELRAEDYEHADPAGYLVARGMAAERADRCAGALIFHEHAIRTRPLEAPASENASTPDDSPKAG